MPPRRVLPTRAGLFVLAAPIVLGVAAVNASNNLLFLLLGALLALIVLSGVLSERNLAGIRVRIRPVGPLYAAEAGNLLVSLERPAERAGRPAYGLFVHEPAGPGFRDSFAVLELRRAVGLAPGGPAGQTIDAFVPELSGRSAAATAGRMFPARGKVELGRLELATQHPFALLTKWRALEAEVEIVVRPRRVPVPEALRDPLALFDAGEWSDHRGAGLEVYGLREREERDALSRLHALRTLSLDREVVVDTAGAERPSAWLGLVHDPGVEPEALERTVELAAALLAAWEAQGFAVGLNLAGERLPPGERSLDALLDRLALLQVAPEDDLADGPGLYLVPAGGRLPSRPVRVARVDAAGRVTLARGGAG